jgi:hypothetical protein
MVALSDLVAASRAARAAGADVEIRQGRLIGTGDAAWLSAVAGLPVVSRGPSRRPNHGASPHVRVAERLAHRRLDVVRDKFTDRVDAQALEAFLEELFPSVLARYERLIGMLGLKAPAQPVSGHVDDPVRDAERIKANIDALQLSIALADRVPMESERTTLRRYSGFGGNNLFFEEVDGRWVPKAKYANQLPAELPEFDLFGLINEFYTPSNLGRDMAEVARSFLPDRGRPLRALEPGAGIGRLVEPWLGDTMQWTLCEYSPLSGRLLGQLYPSADLEQRPFEHAVADNEKDWWQAFDLIVANPPYGGRGRLINADPETWTHKEKNAYRYFARRLFDFAAKDGIVVLLVPGGMLTGTGQQYTQLRNSLLRRAHLLGAYRLPSSVFVGAKLVVDVSFWRARGGTLEEVHEWDQSILAGNYFNDNPAHVLGTEVHGSGRYGYQVEGPYTGLPPLVPRPECVDCGILQPYPAIRRPKRAAPKKQAKGVPKRRSKNAVALTPRLQRAICLAGRVARYEVAVSGGPASDRERAALAHAELVADLEDWNRAIGRWDQVEGLDQLEADGVVELAALRRLFPQGGSLRLSAMLPKPDDESNTSINGIAAIAEQLIRQKESITGTAVADALGSNRDASDVVEDLVALGWCLNPDGSLTPERDYYSGDLWVRYDGARDAAAKGGKHAERHRAQAARLLELIDPVALTDVAESLTPHSSYIPLEMLSRWIHETHDAWPKVPRNSGYDRMLRRDFRLVRDSRGFLVPQFGTDTTRRLQYADLRVSDTSLPRQVIEFVGWLNSDQSLFRPFTPQKSPQSVLDQRREQWADGWLRSWRRWVLDNDDVTVELENLYNRVARGWRAPEYASTQPVLDRWTGAIALRPHQAQGANRAVEQNGGVLAFDVGVGKSFTGVSIIAQSRQNRGVRRPMLIVPRSILLKWPRDFAKCLPDYQVVIIGAEVSTTKSGVQKSRTDTPEERAKKLRDFKDGLYDVALVSDSVFYRAAPSDQLMISYAKATVALLQQEKKEKKEQQGKKGQLTPRQQALLDANVDQRLALRLDIDPKLEDPGITWDELGIDWLGADEAQMFKNLHAPDSRALESNAKYLGASGDGARRSWHFDLRAWDVQRRKGAIVLLSATPAKNSPLEFYNLFQYVDRDWWTTRGVRSPQSFVNEFLIVRPRPTITPDGTATMRPVVVGFRNLLELRTIIGRYGDFRTATSVGLTIPEAQSEIVEVDVNAQQNVIIGIWKEYLRTQAALPPVDRDPGYALRGLNAITVASVHASLAGLPEESGTSEGYAAALKRVAAGEIKPDTPKLEVCASYIASRRSCGHIVFCESLTAHALMRSALVARGVPQERIAILNAETAADVSKRQAIADGFTGTGDSEGAPTYDVVIANQIAYEGIDLQTRTCAIHHLDLPWEPATLIQRNGRGVRQGNQNKTIAVRYYLVPRAGDGYRYEMIQGKQGWMQQLLEGDGDMLPNPAADESASGDEAILIFIADNPEQARALFLEFKTKQRANLIADKRRRAHMVLQAAEKYASRQRRGTTEDPAVAAIEAKKLDALFNELAEFDAESFPWTHLVERMRTTAFWAPRDPGRPVVAGDVWWDNRSNDYRVVGRVGDLDSDQAIFSTRLALDVRWQLHRADTVPDEWLSFELPEGPPAAEPPSLEELAAAAIKQLRGYGSKKVGGTAIALPAGDDAWVRRVWPAIADDYVAVAASNSVVVPVLRDGMLQLLGKTDNGLIVAQGLGQPPQSWVDPRRRFGMMAQYYEVLNASRVYNPLDPGDIRQMLDAARIEVIPPTLEGWQRFIGLIPAASELPVKELGLIASTWWARKLPRGVRQAGSGAT